MKLRGGEFSTGTRGNFQPELTLHEGVGLKRYGTPVFSNARLLPWPDCMGSFPEIV